MKGCGSQSVITYDSPGAFFFSTVFNVFSFSEHIWLSTSVIEPTLMHIVRRDVAEEIEGGWTGERLKQIYRHFCGAPLMSTRFLSFLQPLVYCSNHRDTLSTRGTHLPRAFGTQQKKHMTRYGIPGRARCALENRLRLLMQWRADQTR